MIPPTEELDDQEILDMVELVGGTETLFLMVLSKHHKEIPGEPIPHDVLWDMSESRYKTTWTTTRMYKQQATKLFKAYRRQLK